MAAGYAVKNEAVASTRVDVYPNPNRTGQLFFRVSGLDARQEHTGMIEVYDVQGQILARKVLLASSDELDVSNVAQGMYHWRLTIDGATIGQGKVAIY